jgi:hypothetical protein
MAARAAGSAIRHALPPPASCPAADALEPAPVPAALTLVELDLAVNHPHDQEQWARRNTARLTSFLGSVASAVSLYDLVLLARIGH